MENDGWHGQIEKDPITNAISDEPVISAQTTSTETMFGTEII